MSKIKKYVQLSVSSKQKLSSVLVRLHKSGITSKEALGLSDSELKKNLGFKGSQQSFKALKRNITQLSYTQERKQGVSNQSLIHYSNIGYRGKGLSRVKSQLRKGVGLNIFFDIAKKVQKQYSLTEKQSYKATDTILRQAKVNYKRLDKKERELLSYFS